MIFAIVRTAITGMRRDRASLALSFLMPIAFFSIFAMVFGNQRDTIPRVHVIVVDEDHSSASRNLLLSLEREGSLIVSANPDFDGKGAPPPDYTAASAEAAVKAGNAPVALIIPAGWGEHPIAFDGAEAAQRFSYSTTRATPSLRRSSAGLLQKAAMTAMPAAMAAQGSSVHRKIHWRIHPRAAQALGRKHGQPAEG